VGVKRALLDAWIITSTGWRALPAQTQGVLQGVGIVYAAQSPVGHLVRESAKGMLKEAAKGAPRVMLESAKYTGRIAAAGAKPFARAGAAAGARAIGAAPVVFWAVAPFVAAAGVGATSGAIVGTSISQAIWGEEGKRAALDLYTGGVGWDDYWNTLRRGFVG